MPDKTKSSIRFQYEYEYVYYHELMTGGIDEEEARDIFTCAPDGVCQKGAPHPAIDKLTEYLNLRGDEGWQLVQMFPQDKGILYLFKREI